MENDSRMSPTYHVQIRFRNGNLLRAISEVFPPSDPRQAGADFKSFSNSCGISYWKLMKILSCKDSPYKRGPDTSAGNLTYTASKIVEFLGVSAQELFPPELYSDLIGTTICGYIPAERILSLSDPKTTRLLPSSNPQFPWGIDARRSITAILDTIPKRQKEILIMRFGLDGEGERTLSEVSKEFGVQAERIRQIEGCALRNLRTPERARRLRTLLEELPSEHV